MASVSQQSKPVISAFLSLRHAPHTIRVFRTVAIVFQSMFVWIVFVFQFKYMRVSPSPSSQFEALAQRGESDSAKSSSRQLRSGCADVLSRRALAHKVRSVKKIDEQTSNWHTHLFLNPRRQTLFTQSWVPVGKAADLKGLLVVLHGLNEHSGRYTHFAAQLNSQGYGVYAMDWIDRHPGLPCFLFGHSTGGAVALKAASYSSIEAMLKGVILTSPALRVRPAHPVFGIVAPVFSILVPTFQFKGANKRGIPVSRDPAELAAKYSDPLVYTGPIRVRTGSEILRITSYLQRNMQKISVAFFLLHGTADRVTDPSASQDFYHCAASKHKKLKLYDGYLHDLLFEPEREEITQDIINWMDEMLGV